MSMEARAGVGVLSDFEQLRLGREILAAEGKVLARLAKSLDRAFCRAVDLLYDCQGSVIVTGMGKAGLIGQKLVATLGSTGTPAHWLHPAEAVHGDLGRIGRRDVVLALSQSGQTEEVVRLLPHLAELVVPLLAITADEQSPLGRAADVVLATGRMSEACPLGLAPSSSTTAMLALGDALALVVSRRRAFTAADFARYHPGGALGWKLSRVQEQMRPLSACRLAAESQTVRQVLVGASLPGRRSGAIVLVDDTGRLAGIFTDSDLARLFEQRRDDQLDRPVAEVMTPRPCTIGVEATMTEAVAVMAARKISELPVVDADGRPVGMVDITDVVGMLPADQPPTHPFRRR